MRNLFALHQHILRARFVFVLLLVGLSTGLYALYLSHSPINEAQAELPEKPRASGLPEKPRASDRQVALIVSILLQRDHISKRKLDDDVSEKALKNFLKSLDPAKVYFYQSDFDLFMKSHHDLDDMLKKGDISFAYTVFKTLLTRIDERIEWINALLKEKHDFSIEEEMIIDAEDIGYAKTKDEARDRWRKRIKYNLLQQKSDKVDDAEARKKLARRYQSFAKRMRQTDSDELLEMFLTAITTTYDPHTSYMSPTSLENFYILMRLKLEGIGAALHQEDGQTVVSKIIPGGAADKEGHLKPEDIIVAVDSKGDSELVDVVDMKLSDVVKLIRGKKDTKVRLQVIPQGKSEKKTYTITRAKIELKDSEARSEIIQEGKKADGTPYNIGVIDLPSFYMDMESAQKGIADYKSTTRDVKKILLEFKEKNVDVVILDLRRNGGGSLSEAINLTGLFIDHGPVVQVKGSDDQVKQYSDYERGTIWEGSLVVLTSKLSASASEIFAGAIQDYHRGLVLGDHATHGKGTVQSLVNLGQRLFKKLPNPPKLGALKITIQQFYRPNGASTQNRGVLADVELPSLITHLDIGEADLDYSLKFDRVDAAVFTALKMVEEPVVTQLKQLSEARVKKSKDFKKVNEKIARYEKRKNRKTVSLNEKKFMADRAESKTDGDDEKEKKKKKKDETPPVVERNFYFNETLNITLDYLRLMHKQKVARAG